MHPTRRGKIFSVGETSAPIDPNLQDTLHTLITRIDGMDQRHERLDNRRKNMEEDESRNDRLPRRERAQLYNTANTDAQYIKSVKVDVFSFDGHLGPQGYINW